MRKRSGLYEVTITSLTSAPSVSLYIEAALSRSGTAIATWFSLPNFQSFTGVCCEESSSSSEYVGVVMVKWRRCKSC